MRVAWFSTDRPLNATLNGERLVVKRETLSQEVGFAGATGKSTAGPGKLSRELKHSRAGDPVELPPRDARQL